VGHRITRVIFDVFAEGYNQGWLPTGLTVKFQTEKVIRFEGSVVFDE
jgi:hypothetical protein